MQNGVLELCPPHSFLRDMPQNLAPRPLTLLIPAVAAAVSPTCLFSISGCSLLDVGLFIARCQIPSSQMFPSTSRISLILSASHRTQNQSSQVEPRPPVSSPSPSRSCCARSLLADLFPIDVLTFALSMSQAITSTQTWKVAGPLASRRVRSYSRRLQWKLVKCKIDCLVMTTDGATTCELPNWSGASYFNGRR